MQRRVKISNQAALMVFVSSSTYCSTSSGAAYWTVILHCVMLVWLRIYNLTVHWRLTVSSSTDKYLLTFSSLSFSLPFFPPCRSHPCSAENSASDLFAESWFESPRLTAVHSLTQKIGQQPLSSLIHTLSRLRRPCVLLVRACLQ